jgi:hypothetical protein
MSLGRMVVGVYMLTTVDVTHEDEGISLPDTASLQSLMSSWWRNCIDLHKKTSCSTRSALCLPSRLVDVGMRSIGELVHGLPNNLVRSPSCGPRLISTNGNCPLDCPYVALSYLPTDDELECVPESQFECQSSSLSLQDLPPYFHAACLTAEALGFQLIWIDALCEDRHATVNEVDASLARAQAFQNCAINITADSTASMIRALDGEVCIERASSLPAYKPVPEDIWAADMVSSPLSRVDGCFQDQSFAPRRLHFSETQIYWHCAELKACEMFPDRLPPQIVRNPINDSMAGTITKEMQALSKPYHLVENGKAGCAIPVSWIEAWHCIVHEYSWCTSSSPITRLSGIAGIAREFEALSRDEYVAGLWQGNLINDLLWYTDGTLPRMSNTSNVPSWSWASTNSTVNHHLNSTFSDSLVEIKDGHAGSTAVSSTANADTRCYLELEGYLLKIIPGHYDIKTIWSDCKSDSTEGHHFCLPWCLQTTPQGVNLCGLILRRAEDVCNLAYKRIGMFRFSEGNSMHLLGHGEYIFTKERGHVLDTATLSREIIII